MTRVNRTRQAVHGWRWPAIAALTVIAAGAVVALLQQPPAVGVLDPTGTGSVGGRALADLLTARGQQVLRTTVPVSGSQHTRELDLVTRPDLLSQAQLSQVARFPGDILLVDPDPRALRILAPAIRITGYGDYRVVNPGCAAQPAAMAGDAYLGGLALGTDSQAADKCYQDGPGYELIRYADGTRTISVLGSSVPLTNAYLGDRGDAALALNLLSNATEIVWLVPSPDQLPPAGAGGGRSGQQPFFALVPRPVYLIAIQLAIAVLLAAAWRARRLGPLVAERLPVIVRAAETVEGHGRLYQSLRARDGAARKLRAAAKSTIARLTATGTGTRTGTLTGAGTGTGNGNSADAGPATVADARTATIAARAGQTPAEVTSLLDGPPPTTDEDLVTLAADLDTLIRKIRQS
jgi:hypothetical protein